MLEAWKWSEYCVDGYMTEIWKLTVGWGRVELELGLVVLLSDLPSSCPEIVPGVKFSFCRKDRGP